MSSPSNLLNIARKYAEPHVASNVRYIASSMRTNSLLTRCKQRAVLSRYSNSFYITTCFF